MLFAEVCCYILQQPQGSLIKIDKDRKGQRSYKVEK